MPESRSSPAGERRAAFFVNVVTALLLFAQGPRGTLAYSTFMLDDPNCGRALAMETVIMGAPIVSRDSQQRPIVTDDAGQEISDVVAGTVVSVSFEVPGYTHVLETSAGAFEGLNVGCSDNRPRTTSTDVSLAIPADADGQIIVLRAAFAAEYGPVTLAQEVQLTVVAPQDPSPTPEEPMTEPEITPPPPPPAPPPPPPAPPPAPPRSSDPVIVAAGPEPTVVSPGDAILPLSQANTLVLLAHVSSGGARKPAGRCYDGFDWEAVALSAAAILNFDCADDGCFVALPELSEGDYYEIEELEGPDAPTDSEAAACVPPIYDADPTGCSSHPNVGLCCQCCLVTTPLVSVRLWIRVDASCCTQPLAPSDQM